MKEQKDLINNEDWECLIILDACRYDIFRNNYHNFFTGSLRKVDSNSVHTGEWLDSTFKKLNDGITYISASPCVNSFGVSLLETNPYWGIDWTATEHFQEIVDVWEFGWSDELESVPPRAVTESASKVRGRRIVHYMQPHIPYLKLKEGDKKDEANARIGRILPRTPERSRAKGEGNPLFNAVETVGLRLTEIFGKEVLWRVKKSLGIPPVETMEEAWRLGAVYKVYLDNLLRSMREAKRLVKSVEGKVVITSDHGECLGECGYWGHGLSGGEEMPKIPTLVHVPWLVVEDA